MPWVALISPKGPEVRPELKTTLYKSPSPGVILETINLSVGLSVAYDSGGEQRLGGIAPARIKSPRLEV